MIWERYFIREIMKILLLFLICFYGLYVLIDYSSHSSGSQYFHSHMKWGELILYYLCEFVQRLDVLLPFAILLATIRTLYNLNAHSELVALMASGMKLKTLLRPFIMVGLVGTAILFLNTEFFIPGALRELRHTGDKHALKKKKYVKNMSVEHVNLEDDTTLLFQKYDTAQNYFSDAYWIKSSKDIYKIQDLYPGTTVPVGKNVTHLVRDASDEFVQKETYQRREFPEIKFNRKSLLDTITPVEEFSLSSLLKKFPSHSNALSEKEAQVISTYYKKLAMPWLCLFAVLAPAPFCVRFSRHIPIFFIYAFSIFGLVAFYLVIDAATVLGERQVVGPAWAIWTPFAVITGLIGWRFSKI
jgi:lipopolysaccharide export system permease protein